MIRKSLYLFVLHFLVLGEKTFADEFSIPDFDLDPSNEINLLLSVERDALSTGNVARSSQIGDANFSMIAQDGFLNRALVAQRGEGNVGAIIQYGDSNLAIIQQNSGYAGENDALIIQDGNDNQAVLIEDGFLNDASILQSGNFNSAALMLIGDRNTAVIEQGGGETLPGIVVRSSDRTIAIGTN